MTSPGAGQWTGDGGPCCQPLPWSPGVQPAARREQTTAAGGFPLLLCVLTPSLRCHLQFGRPNRLAGEWRQRNQGAGSSNCRWGDLGFIPLPPFPCQLALFCCAARSAFHRLERPARVWQEYLGQEYSGCRGLKILREDHVRATLIRLRQGSSSERCARRLITWSKASALPGSIRSGPSIGRFGQ